MSQSQKQDKHLTIEDRLESMESKVDIIIDLLSSARRMTMKEIADYYKVPRQSLYTTRRYLLPNFGKDMPKDGYTFGEVVAWSAYGVENLRQAWIECRHP